MICTNCGTQQPENDAFCTQCGRQLAGSQAISTRKSAHRDGARLVVTRGAVLPAICAKCGQPANGIVKEKSSWHHPGLYLLIFLGLLPYALIATLVTRKMEVLVPICDFHRQRRIRFRVIGLAMFLGSAPLAWATGSILGDGGWGWGILLFLGLLFAGAAVFDRARLLTPASIDSERGIFKGAAEPFLSRLPGPAV